MVTTRSSAMGRIQPNGARGSVSGQDASVMEYLDDQTVSITFEHQAADDDDDDDVYSSDDAVSRDSHVDGSNRVRGADPSPARGGEGLAPIALLGVSSSALAGGVRRIPSDVDGPPTVPEFIDITHQSNPSSRSVISATTNHSNTIASTRQEPWGSVRPTFVPSSTPVQSNHLPAVTIISDPSFPLSPRSLVSTTSNELHALDSFAYGRDYVAMVMSHAFLNFTR